MKKFLIRLLVLMLMVTAYVTISACSDDDDDTPVVVINDVMVIYNRDTGLFSAINKTTGELTDLGSILFEGEPLLKLRDVVYHKGSRKIYATSNANSPGDGRVFSVNPSTLEATVINDNMDEDWYAIPEIVMDGDKIMGTVYWDEYNDNDNVDYYTGLIWLNQDGSMFREIPFMFDNEIYDICCGMGLEYGDNNNEILVSYEREILRVDMNGNISEMIELDPVGFPNDRLAQNSRGGSYLGYIRCIEKDNNGILYGVDENGAFGTINLELGTFNFISYIRYPGSDDDDDWLALSMIPENIFPEE